MLSEREKQRWALRKLTVGLSSVLLGMTFLGVNGTAQAATSKTDSGSAVVTEETTNSGTGDTAKTEAAKTTVAADAGTQSANKNTADIAKTNENQTTAAAKLAAASAEPKTTAGLDQTVKKTDQSQTKVESATDQTNDGDQKVAALGATQTEKADANKDATSQDETKQTLKIDQTAKKLAAAAKSLKVSKAETTTPTAGTQTPVQIKLVHQTTQAKSQDDLTAAGDTTDTGVVFSKDVTRTIKYVDAQGNAIAGHNPTTQKVTFTRTAIVDKVTKKITGWVDPSDSTKTITDKSKAWSTNGDSKWSALTTADTAIDGYDGPYSDNTLTTEKKVAEQTVNADTDNQTVTLYYAKKQSNTLTFVDDDDNGAQVGKTIPINGHQGQTVNWNAALPENYELATGQSLPTNYTFTGETETPVKVHLIHQTVQVSDPNQWNDAGVAQADQDALTKTVTRTINYVDAQGNAIAGHNPTQQTVTFKRTAIVDKVTKKIKAWVDPNDGSKTVSADQAWTSDHAQWDAQAVSAVEGYDGPYSDQTLKNNISSVSAKTVNATDSDETVDVYYAKQESNTLTFVDDDDNGAQVGKTITINGHQGKTVNWNAALPENYELADGQTIPSSYEFTQSDPTAVVVHLKHKQVAVDENTTDKDGNHAKLSEEVKRTITANVPDGNGGTTAQDLSQTTTLTRTATKDAVTGEFVYGAWSKGTFAEINAPKVNGYTPSQATIAAQEAVYGYVDPKIEINYTAKDQSISYKFVDDDNNGEQVGTDIVVTGKTDETVDISSQVKTPDNYVLTEGETLPTSYKFKANGNEPVTIHLKHRQDAVDENTTDKDGKHAKLSEEVKRTITANVPDGNGGITAQDLSQTATLTRTATKDAVTGEFVYGEWSKGTFAAVNAPKVDGYTPSQATVATQEAVDGYVDPKIKINYTAKDQSISFKFVDDDNNGSPVGTDIVVNGKTDEIVNPSTSVSVPTNYVLADGQTIPTSYKFKATGNDSVTIHLKHKLVNNEHPAESLTKTVTRTINDQLPTGSKTTTQVVKFTRTVTKDLVSGATTAGDWTLATDSPAQDWAEYTAQVPAGYSAKINGVAGNTVAKYTINPNDTKLTDSVTITYTANSQTATVIFVDGDKNNEQVGSGQTISGQTDQTVDLPAIPANYATDASQSKTYKFTAEPNQTITITLHHKHEDVTDQSQLTKEVKRTISITKPGETATTQTQTVKFTRTGSKDLVTGETSYTDWKADGTDTWDAVNVPSVDGYSAVIKDGEQTLSEIASQTVTAEMADQTITVTYAANDQTLHISYIDSDDPTKQLTGQDITGTTGQTISLAGKLSLPENYELSADTPSSYTFKASDNSLEVKLVHKRQAITDQSQLTKEIKRIINITEPGKAATTQTQTVKFTRTGSKDLVTGDTSYTDWQADGTDTWAEVSVPTVSGYTPSQATIAAETVDPKTATDQTVTITYTANDQDITVTYVDDDDSTRHPQDETIHGKTGQTINVAEQLKNVPNGYDLADSTISYTVKAEGANTVEVHLKHHLEDLTDETKTFTRTIIEHQPSGDQTKTQTATFKRTAKLDKVTNQTINGAWTAASEGSDKWAEYVPTAVAGYTPSEVQVAEETVDPNTATDQTVEINYTPAEHTIKVKFVDDDAGGAQVGAIATISGKTGATIDLPGTPTNYDLASGQNATYKVTSDSDQTVEVHLTHKHEAINDPSELTKEITRTISITKPGETATTQTQTVKFTRTGSKDLVTERKTYTEWQAEGGKDSWESVTVPTVAGYTPSQTTIAAEKVDPKTATNQTVTITYTANDQTITVKYVDDDAGGAQVGETSTISGKTGTSITLPTYQDNRYESKAGTYEVTGASDQTVEVHLTHKHQSSQSTKNISRTIVLDIPGQTQPETITQTVKFVQNNDTDLVTNQVKQGVWTVSGSDKWDAYTPKAVAGYTPSQNSVAEQTVTSDTPNTTVTITYSQNAKSAKITFVDDDNGGQQIGQPVTINGQAGTSLDLSSDIPTNYQLVSASDNTYVFTTDENQTKTIHLKHKTESVTDSKTVKRTITENIPGKSPKTTDQEVVFTRTGTKDLVTNQTTYGAWDVGTNGGKWAAYTPTAVPGYTPSVSTVSEQTVTPETGNATVTITYTKQSQSVSASVKFIDADNHDASVSGSATIQGTVDEQADLSQLTLPANYELAPGQSYTFTSDQGQTVTLKLKHKLQVQADQTKTVTRTIVEHIPGQTETTRTTQTVTFKRTVATDLVTNQPVYGNWQADGDSQWQVVGISSTGDTNSQPGEVPSTAGTIATPNAVNNQQTAKANTEQDKLPQTGNESESAIGIGLAIGASLLGLAGADRRKKHE